MLAVIFMLLVLVLLALPFLPIRLPFTLFWFNFPEEKRPRNIVYIISTLVVILVTILLMPYILEFAEWFRQLRFVVWLRSLVPTHAQYSGKIFTAVFANVLFCLMVFFANWVTGTMFGWNPKLSPSALRMAMREAKAKRAARRAARKAKRQARKNKKNKDEETSEEPVEDTLPPELYPAPEQKDFESHLLLQGAGGETTVTRKAAQRKKSDIDNEEEDGFSLRRWFFKFFELFYVKIDDAWYAQPQCKKVAKHLRNFIILTGLAYLVLFTLLMIPIFFKVQQLSDPFYRTMSRLVEDCYLYPAVSLVLLTQIFWFMNGKLQEEPVDELIYGTSKRTAKIVDLDKLEEDLIQSAGQAYEIKSFYSGDVEGQERARIPVDTSEDAVLQAVVRFVESQRLVRNDDYLRGIQALQRGEDALFDAPLFTPVSMYLYPYLNVRISQGERLVVICQKQEDIPGIIDNLKKGFCLVQRTHECLWNIHDRTGLEFSNTTDVLVLTPRDFMDDGLFVEAEQFFRRVTVALLPDADQVVMSNNYLCVIIAERLKQAVQKRREGHYLNDNEKNIQYLFLSTRHTLNLAQSLTEYFMLEQDVKSVQAEYAYGNVRLYVWREKGKSRPLLDNTAQQVKLESVIAEIAGKNNVPKITVFTDVAIFANQIDSTWLDTYDVFDRPVGFTVVSDDSYNLPGTIYTYSRYIGKQASVLHVISKPYMLRDYFFDNAIRSLYERPLMERGMVEHAQMRQTGALLLLCRLMKGIPVTEFAMKMAEITEVDSTEKLTYPQIRQLVDACLTMAFGREANAEEYGFRLMDRVDNTFTTVPYIQIRESGILEHLMKETELVKVKISGNRDYKILPLFRRMLAQKHLPGQHMVIDHSNYQITGIDFENGIINATAARAVHNVPDQYIQVREYTAQDCKTFLDCCRHYATGGECEIPANITGTSIEIHGNSELTSLTMVQGTGALEIDSHTVAYYDSTDYRGQLNLVDGSVFSVKKDLHRKVENALYLRLEGDFAADDQLTMTLSVLLQEMMKTLFPDQFFCISVCPILRDPDSIYNHSDALSSRIASLYPRLKGWEKPADNTIELLIVDDCQGGTGVLDILFQQEAVYVSNILDMLCEYLDWLQEHPQGAYLNYGSAETPQLYKLERVRELLDVFYKGYQREHDLFQEMDKRNCCALCEKNLTAGETYVWNNKYNICPECEDEMVPNQEQADQILQHIRRFVERRFGEKLGNISVEFDERIDISGVDVSAGKILLEPGLPLTAVHAQLAMQAVRLWQLSNLLLTGEPEFEGQLLYVLLQYLQELEQHQHRKRLHSRALLGKDDRAVGYCRLRQALQVEKHDNSFRYMRELFSGNGKPTPGPTPAPTPTPDPGPRPGNRRSTRVDPQNIRHFHREQLPDNEKLFYDLLLKGLTDRAESIDVAAAKVHKDDSSRLWNCVINDHPELHWVNHLQFSYNAEQLTGLVVTITPNYWVDTKEHDKRQAEIDQVIPEYLEGVTQESGDYEAALQIYMNIARKMDYDSLALDRQKARTRATGKHGGGGVDDLRNIYGALVLRRPVCHGYALAYQYLLQKVGIESLVACGDCHNGGAHAWNVVKLEGDYYHTDVTWGDGSNTDAAKNVDEPNFAYFCLNDREIGLTRTIEKEPPVPACTATACNYFVRNGLYFTAYDHGAVTAVIAKLLQEPARRRVDLRFASKTIMDVAQRQLQSNGGLQELLRTTGRTGSAQCMAYPKLNILNFFFEPLKPSEDSVKPEEAL